METMECMWKLASALGVIYISNHETCALGGCFLPVNVEAAGERGCSLLFCSNFDFTVLVPSSQRNFRRRRKMLSC